MGDRASVYIREDATRGVFLYTHWGGTELPQTVQAALKRGRERWNDAPYLARIVFCEMVKGVEMDLTGYGISSYIDDNQVGRPIIVLDPDTHRLGFAPEPEYGQPPIATSWMAFNDVVKTGTSFGWPANSD